MRSDIRRQRRMRSSSPMLRVSCYPRDYVLLIVLLLMAILVFVNWSDYDECRYPMNVWLVVNFFSFITFRLLQFAFEHFATGPRVGFCGRHGPRLFAALVLYVVYPFMWVWSCIGVYWYNKSHDCLPDTTTGWWFVAWVIYSFIYLIAYGLLIYSAHRIRQSQSIDDIQEALRQLQQAQAYGFTEAVGLSDEQIDALGTRVVTSEDSDVCTVCLVAVQPGETVFDLPCRHVFHSDCLRPWLLVRDTCPNCVQRVNVPRDDDPLIRVHYGSEHESANTALLASSSSYASAVGPSSSSVGGANPK